jgi:hypothetical protein
MDRYRRRAIIKNGTIRALIRSNARSGKPSVTNVLDMEMSNVSRRTMDLALRNLHTSKSQVAPVSMERFRLRGPAIVEAYCNLIA